jgi:Na+/proline symporter
VITSGNTSGGYNWSDRYNIWSGIIGGFFLALSYFGTDQSQVGRYLTAKSIAESRLGLLMNGLVKVPMQFFILLVGALVFTFYQFNQAPLFFNQTQVEKVEASAYRDSLHGIQRSYAQLSDRKKQLATQFTREIKTGSDTRNSSLQLQAVNAETEKLRTQFKNILARDDVRGDANDTNYIFLRFVVDNLPKGLIGLLIAVIFLASWGSIAAALNSLASSTVVDIHKKFVKTDCTDAQDYSMSKWYTFAWGVFSIIVAQFAGNMGSLIEAVNVLGSLFYGVILGIFLVAFYLKRINGNIVFLSALVIEVLVIFSFAWPWLLAHSPGLVNILPGVLYRFIQASSSISFLWLNVIGALGVVLLSIAIQTFFPRTRIPQAG